MAKGDKAAKSSAQGAAANAATQGALADNLPQLLPPEGSREEEALIQRLVDEGETRGDAQGIIEARRIKQNAEGGSPFDREKITQFFEGENLSVGTVTPRVMRDANAVISSARGQYSDLRSRGDYLLNSVSEGIYLQYGRNRQASARQVDNISDAFVNAIESGRNLSNSIKASLSQNQGRQVKPQVAIATRQMALGVKRLRQSLNDIRSGGLSNFREQMTPQRMASAIAKVEARVRLAQSEIDNGLRILRTPLI